MNSPIHPADYFVIVLYFVFIIAIGFFRSKWQQRQEIDYLLAGRRLSLIPFTASVVATWYGGILGIGEFTYLYGFSNWVVFGLPYYFFALFFALFLAKRIRQNGRITIPDRFYDRYGKRAGILSAIFVMILASPAPYILSTGMILHLLFGMTLFPALVFATLLSLVYIYYGGFQSVIRTDIFQFILMFSGFILIVALSAQKFGGFTLLSDALPPQHLTWSGGHSSFYILAWFFIALWTFVDPGFYQRCAAARTPHIARQGIFLSILFWALFDFLTLSTGLYARAMLPQLHNPLLSIPLLGMEVLPPFLLGLFFAGILSTIMSTVDSLGFISATTFGRDIIWRNFSREKNCVRWTQLGLVITGILALFLAWLLPSVVNLWYAIGSVVVPGLLIPFLTTFSKRKKIPGITWMMAISAGINLCWFMIGMFGDGSLPRYPLGIEPFYPGLAVSVIWWIVAEYYPFR